ncbi:MAG: lectin-like protein [Kofleriaceae bacterium]
MPVGDASADQPSDQSLPDAPCETWYLDSDGDGHGDPATTMTACTQPASYVLTSDDCDDDERYRHPGGDEVCDGIDNDCDNTTTASCPNECVAVRRPAPKDARVYLFCATELTWSDAYAACAQQGFLLAQVDDASEDAFLTNEADDQFAGDDFWIGGTDEGSEATWRWGGGDVFWSNGSPQPGQYANWASGEPDDHDLANCLNIDPSDGWHDDLCVRTLAFVCRR